VNSVPDVVPDRVGMHKLDMVSQMEVNGRKWKEMQGNGVERKEGHFSSFDMNCPLFGRWVLFDLVSTRYTESSINQLVIVINELS
jgi:hypothetical protein